MPMFALESYASSLFRLSAARRLLRSFLAAALFALFSAALSLAASDTPAPEPPSPAEDGTLEALTTIAGKGMMQSHAYSELEELSDDVGGRVTGTPLAARADGQDAHREKTGRIPQGVRTVAVR